MCPPPIYPQLPHFYNHGLAIPSISSKKNGECFSPRLSSKSSSPQRDGALKKREREKSIDKKRKEKRKASRVSANKKGKSIF
jgi:hypothetical protein